jgi:hypothetical protein
MRDVELCTLENQKSDKEGDLAFAKEPSTKELDKYDDIKNILNIERKLKNTTAEYKSAE